MPWRQALYINSIDPYYDSYCCRCHHLYRCCHSYRCMHYLGAQSVVVVGDLRLDGAATSSLIGLVLVLVELLFRHGSRSIWNQVGAGSRVGRCCSAAVNSMCGLVSGLSSALRTGFYHVRGPMSPVCGEVTSGRMMAVFASWFAVDA